MRDVAALMTGLGLASRGALTLGDEVTADFWRLNAREIEWLGQRLATRCLMVRCYKPDYVVVAPDVPSELLRAFLAEYHRRMASLERRLYVLGIKSTRTNYVPMIDGHYQQGERGLLLAGALTDPDRLRSYIQAIKWRGLKLDECVTVVGYEFDSRTKVVLNAFRCESPGGIRLYPLVSVEAMRELHKKQVENPFFKALVAQSGELEEELALSRLAA